MPLGLTKQRALGSFSWLLADKLMSLGSAAIIGILIARELGPADYGLQNYVIAFGSLAAAVGGLGFGGLITRDLAYQPDNEGLILGTVSVLTTAASVFLTIVTTIWVIVLPPIDPRIGWLIVLVVGSGIFKRFEFLEAWFILHHKTKSYVISRIAVAGLFSVIRIVLLFLHADLQVFLITYALEVATSGIRSLIAYRIASGGSVKWQFSSSVAIQSFGRSWPSLVSVITQFIYLRLDVVLLTWWTTNTQAGIYSAAARLSEIWYFVPTLLMSALFPALLKLRQNDTERYSDRLQDLLDLLSASGMLLALGVSAIAWFAIPLLYGEEFSAAAPILMIHVWAGVFVFMRALLSKWFIAEELYIYSLMTHGAGAVINVALNVWLIPRYAGIGAAIATLVSYATAGYLSLYLNRRTRPMFWMMTKSLLWVRRAPEGLVIGKAAAKAIKGKVRNGRTNANP